MKNLNLINNKESIIKSLILRYWPNLIARFHRLKTKSISIYNYLYCKWYNIEVKSWKMDK